MTTLDLATVFYAGDALLMQLQARSIARFMDPASIGSIKLVENDVPGAITQQDRDKIFAQYGPLRGKVEFIPREDLGYMATDARGWRTQQALKLAIGQKCDQEFVVLLDCKNHLIRAANYATFVTSDGLARQYFSRKYDPQQAAWLEQSWAYFGMNRRYDNENLPSTITPYPIQTQLLRELTDEIAKRDGSIFELMNSESFGGTEFYLLLAYVQWRFDGDIAPVYKGDMPRPATMFASWPTKHSDIQRTIAQATRRETDFFALHPNRKTLLTQEEWADILTLWEECDLILPEVVSFYAEHLVSASCQQSATGTD
jgi:hypothetical protein